MSGIDVSADDPRRADIVSLLEAHLTLMRRISPPGHVHALDVGALAQSHVTFLAARSVDGLLGVGALKELGDRRGEIKSMHTVDAARGRGIGRLLVEHLLDLANERDLTWIGLETGTQPEFAAARTLYASVGFATCEPFDDYTVNRYSTCMSLDLTN